MDPPVPFSNHTHYRSYLLRLWQAGVEGETPTLRIVLVSPHTGEKRSFSSLEEMVRFLEGEVKDDQGEENKGLGNLCWKSYAGDSPTFSKTA